MKDFTQLVRSVPKPDETIQKQKEDKEFFVKRSLSRSIDRSPEIQQAVLDWLITFKGAIGKEQFQKQLCKLSFDDVKAKEQLSNSTGKRIIQQLPRVKPPKVTESLLVLLGKYNLVAVEASSGKKLIEQFLSTLPEAGVYILDVNELILEYTDYQHRGKAGEIIEAAHRADLLVIEGLEKPIALAYHIKDTLYQLATVRKKNKDKFTLSTWNYTHQWYIQGYIENFQLFSA